MKSLRLFLEDADRDAALEKLKSKRAKAAEKSQRTRDEFYKSSEENKKKAQSDIDSVSREGDSERKLSQSKAKAEAQRVAGKRAKAAEFRQKLKVAGKVLRGEPLSRKERDE